MSTEQETLDAIGEIATSLQAVVTGQEEIITQARKTLLEIEGALNGHHVPGSVTDKLKTLASIVEAAASQTTSLKTVVQSMDDLNADAPAEPPTEPPTT